LLNHVREQQDIKKNKNKFWEMAGSKMGDLLGIKKEVRCQKFRFSHPRPVTGSLAVNVWIAPNALSHYLVA